MFQETRIAANGIATKLFEAESAIDAALAAVAALTANIPLANQQAKAGFHVGHEALMHAMESCQQLVKARSNMLRTHKALAVAQNEVGLGAVAFNGNCPESAELSTPVRHLTAVAA